jgi:hypothetical protein
MLHGPILLRSLCTVGVASAPAILDRDVAAVSPAQPLAFASSSPLTPATQSGLSEQKITPRGVKPANKAERSAAEPVKRAIPGVNRDFPPGQAL